MIAVATEGDTTIGGLVEHVIRGSARAGAAEPAHRDCAAATAGVLHCRAARVRRGPAAQPGEERDGGVGAGGIGSANHDAADGFEAILRLEMRDSQGRISVTRILFTAGEVDFRPRDGVWAGDNPSGGVG